MKLTMLLLFLGGMAIGANGYSQSAKINLRMKNASFVEFVKKIESQSEYYFFYKNDELGSLKAVDINVNNASVEEILSKVLKDSDLTYKVVDHYIVISPKDGAAAKYALINQTSKREVKGKVTDEGGEPLPGVSVVVKGTTIGITTDFDGNYSLEVPAGGEVLVFSFVGMIQQEVAVEGRTTISVTMREDTKDLDEVVVVGYGTQTRSMASSAYTQVEGDDISKLPVANATQALESFVPSVTVTSSASEKPGASPTLRIRGESSLNGGAPLILIDGVAGSMNSLNPNDIKSFTILKDAASTAIYGARGSGGVILITTKSGKYGEDFKVSYSGNLTIKTPTLLPEMLDSRIYAEGRANAELNRGINTLWNHPDILAALDDPSITNIPSPRRPTTHFVGTDNVDWIGEVLGNSTLQQHNVSIEGGTKKAGYRASVGYIDETALYNYGDFGYERYNFRSNVNTKVANFIDLDIRMSFSRTENDSPVRGWDTEIWQTYFMHPFDPIKWDTGDWGGNNGGNPIHDLVEGGHSLSITDQLNLNFNAKLKLAKNLNFTGVAAYKITHTDGSDDKRTILRYSVQPGVVIGKYYDPNEFVKYSSASKYKNFQGYFTWLKSLNNIHNIKLMTGASYEEDYNDSFNARRQDYFSNELLHSLDLGTGEQFNGGAPSDWAIGSFFGRLNYNFKEKYLLEASCRFDGSSRFVSDERWGFFPSISAAWRLTEENFTKNISWLSDLKVRSSWGKVGNQSGIGLYDYIAKLTVSGDYPMGSDYDHDKWVIQNSLASPSRSWETIETINAGVDFGFLRNRLSGSFEYYTKFNKDMLVPVAFPSVIGFGVPTYNSGELKVQGWEGVLSWQDKLKDFKYGISVSVHDSKNEITRFDRSKNLVSGTQNIEGYAMGSYFGYKTDGYFQTDEEVDNWAFQHGLNAAGDVKYVDLDDSGKIDAGDVTYLGNSKPRYNYTININASWKNIDFTATFDGVGKKNVYLSGDIVNPINWPKFESHLDYWTEDNRDAAYPRLMKGDNWNWWMSDRSVWDASYLRLKNVQIGYTLPKSLSEKMHLSNLRVYVNGRNLLTFDNYIPFLDPQITSVNQYPVLTSFSAGLNITF